MRDALTDLFPEIRHFRRSAVQNTLKTKRYITGSGAENDTYASDTSILYFFTERNNR